MKNILYIIFLIFILTIIIPVVVLKAYKASSSPIDFEKKEKKEKRQDKVENKTKHMQYIDVYMVEQDKVTTMKFDEYLKGVLAAEMPAKFELEALKAQAVAARTYTLHKIISADKKVKNEHKGADICTNYAHCQAWKSKKQLKQRWGFFSYIKYWRKISKAVEQTNKLVIEYNGKLIDPLFHSTSGGRTENSEEVFLTKLPYLRSVESPGEENAPNFKNTVEIDFEEFKRKLSEIANGLIITPNDIKDIKIIEQSEGGRVEKIKIGNKVFNGKEIRQKLSLNSADFKIKLKNNKVVINTKGYGHGVGMSQFGANHLAQEGKSFRYILKHYYKGVEIVKRKINK